MEQKQIRSEDFAHLHVHSVYSLLDGACRIEELIEHVKTMGQTSVAVTDHGNLYVAVQFAQAAEKSGIHPVIGCEVYVAARTRFDKEHALDRTSDHLLLLCENETGYRNLVQLVTKANLEGFYHRPRVDEELLREYSEGLICLSGCIAGKIPRLILAGEYERAKATAMFYREIFGKENYFIEVQNHGISEELSVLPKLIRLSRETGIPLAATNDAHYITKEDSSMQNVLLCIQTGRTTEDDTGMGFDKDEFYLKSTAEMAELFVSVPDAVTNTARIAERCNVKFETGKVHLPKFQSKDGVSSNKLFASLCREGLIRKYGSDPPKEAVERMKHEMSVIGKMGFVDYFLIVWDYVSFARKNNIPVGPGRGSGAGSICAYCLDITQIDPLKYSLLFERFLNPERVSMPDFDIDFCIEGRQKVKDYVIERYGKECVSEIITFDVMKARGAVRDTGRAMNMPYALCDRIAKLIDPMRTIKENLDAKDGEELRQIYRTDSSAKKLIDMAMRLEGVPRHTSTHAAGVIISAFPIEQLVPMQYNDETVVTQYTMNTLESLGLLKFDFLGLRNLTVIRDCIREIHQYEPDFSIDDIPLDDPDVYKMMSLGDTTGVFQFESAGMRRVLIQLQPENIEDLTAVLSLYRPGPRDSIPKYIENRHHPEKITYAHPLLEPILRVTNGCIVYQEQVMEICRSLAGYSYGRADLVRRAMSKKKRDVMEKEREIFIHGDGESIAGAVSKGVSEETAERIFDEISGFASYAFNKSHAAAYSYLAYQTAYLKKYYFADYMAALMTSVTGDTPKLLSYMEHCVSGGVKILPPHVNESGTVFLRRGKDISFGLLAVKNLGHSFIRKLTDERRRGGLFTGLHDFCRRMAGTELNKRGLESLIGCGAFDGLGLNRRQMLAYYESILESSRDMLHEQVEGQMDLFGNTGNSAVYDTAVKQMPEFPDEELLRLEKEFSGMYLSGHPLWKYRMASALLHTTDFSEMNELSSSGTDGMQVTSICIVRQVKKHVTKKGDTMCFMTCEDAADAMDCVVFPNLFSAARQKLVPDRIIYISGKLSVKDEEVSLICDSILSAEELERKIECGRLCCKVISDEREKISSITTLCREHHGNTPFCFYFTDKRKMASSRSISGVQLSDDLISGLREIAGEANIGII